MNKIQTFAAEYKNIASAKTSKSEKASCCESKSAASQDGGDAVNLSETVRSMPPTADPAQWLEAQKVPLNENREQWLNLDLKCSVFGYYELQNSHVKQIVKNLNGVIENYYDGKMNVEDLKKCFEDSYSAIIKHNVDIGRTSGNNAEHNKIMLKDTYDFFTYSLVNAANNAVYKAGLEIAKKYGATGELREKKDWVYYDADQYYAHLDAMNAVKECAQEMSEKNGFGMIDTKPDGKYTDNLFAMTSFKSEISNLIDLTTPPPKGFTLFFKESKYSEEDFKHGERFTISASDPTAGENQTGAVTYNIIVPRGASLLKNPYDKTLLDFLYEEEGKNRHNGDSFNGLILNINGLLGKYKQADLFDRVKAFMRDNLNNFDEGVLIMGKGKQQTVSNVPFYVGSVENFNAAQVPNLNLQSNDESINNYLKNIQIFTGSYGYSHGLKK